MSLLCIPTFKDLKQQPCVDYLFFEILVLLGFHFTTKKVTRTFKKKIHEVEILEKIEGIYVRTFLMENKYIIGLSYEDRYIVSTIYMILLNYPQE
jgi:hypothetical protein